MKKHALFISTIVCAITMFACSADNSNRENTGNGSMESPTNGIPTGNSEPDSTQRDNTRVDKDTVHP